MGRKCGVLLPITSLPSRYGIGCFSKEAYEFVDFLAEAGQSYWQILPLGQTGYGDSPYQSFSTFGGNPYFVDPAALVQAGWLSEEDVLACDFGSDPQYVNYEAVYHARLPLLFKAYQNSPFALHLPGNELISSSGAAQAGPSDDDLQKVQAFEIFCEENREWLPDYALFSAVKNRSGGKSYIEWDDDIRLRREDALLRYREELSDEIRFYEFVQYLFHKQWFSLKKYANDRGIEIIGDIPIYVAFDSADTWANPELFEFDEKGYPRVVAGCPPDAFAATGQLWGNPIYRWDYHRQTGYAWWIRRLRKCFELYDVVRIDHFRGFDEFYAIPYGDPTAEFGKWMPGPGLQLFQAMKEALGEQRIIAEDLGYITDSVRALVRDTGYPNMKVLQFGFDAREESDYLPHGYVPNCVVYTGTHDNETMRGWYENVNEEDRRMAQEYLMIPEKEPEVAWHFIACALMSVGETAIIPMQDYLNLGNEARINWQWRLLPGQCDEKLAKRMRRLAKLYGRLGR